MSNFSSIGTIDAPRAIAAVAFSNRKLFFSCGNNVSSFDPLTSTRESVAITGSTSIKAIDAYEENKILAAIDADRNLLIFGLCSGRLLYRKRLSFDAQLVKFIGGGEDQSPPNVVLSSASELSVWRVNSYLPSDPMMMIFKSKMQAGAPVKSFSWKSGQRGMFVLGDANVCRVYRRATSGEYDCLNLSGHKENIAALAFGEVNSNMIVSISLDGCVFEWSFHTYASERPTARRSKLANVSKICCASFDLHGAHLAVLSLGTLHVYSTASLHVLLSIRIGESVTRLDFDKTGEYLALLGESRLGMLELSSQSMLLDITSESKATSCLALNENGSVLVTGADDGQVKLWNVRSFMCVATLNDHTNAVSAVEFLPSRDGFISASLDGTIRAYDILRCRNFRVFTSSFECRFNCFAVDDSGDILSAGSLDAFQIFLWSFKTGKLLEILSGHGAIISGLHFCNEALLVSGSWDKTVRLWDIGGQNESQILPCDADVLALAVCGNTRRISASVTSQKLLFCTFDEQQLIGSIDYGRDLKGMSNLNEQTIDLNFTSIKYSSTGSLLLGGTSKGIVCVYDCVGLTLLKRYSTSSGLGGDVFNRDSGKLAYSALADVWSVIGEDGIHIYERNLHSQNYISENLDEKVELSTIFSALRQENFREALHRAFNLAVSLMVPKAVIYSIPIKQNLMHEFSGSTQAQQLFELCAHLITHSVHLERMVGVMLNIVNGILPLSNVDYVLLRCIFNSFGKIQANIGNVAQHNLNILNFICVA